ncbi:hypothetical protein MMC29_000407 [Sticta canariensis]|nr:hypothetical protein [Sticta canariensis]
MSTITSPRPSLTALTTPSSSRRTSLDPPSGPQAPSPQVDPPRRNRTALRDYYGLKAAVSADVINGAQQQETVVRDSELDAEGFDSEGYVREVLAREGLEGVLRIEAGLVNGLRSGLLEIKGLDGERKALVYDNYSKLIAATDTIRKMRSNMDPLTPTTSTLSPAISHIAETATSLSTSFKIRGLTAEGIGGSGDDQSMATGRKQEQQETVRWVCGAPHRLQVMLDAGRGEEAADDWVQVQRLLGKWAGINGVEDLRDRCMKVMMNRKN